MSVYTHLFIALYCGGVMLFCMYMANKEIISDLNWELEDTGLIGLVFILAAAVGAVLGPVLLVLYWASQLVGLAALKWRKK